MSNHLHLLVGVMGDPDPSALLRDFKSYASRSLNREYGKPASGTWWTEQGSKRKVKNSSHFENARNYILRQPAPLAIWENERRQ
jgi:REP element-mobilizing transposase RayT